MDVGGTVVCHVDILAFCGNVGTKAWLLQWPLQVVQVALLRIEEDEGSLRLESTEITLHF